MNIVNRDSTERNTDINDMKIKIYNIGNDD